MNKPKLFFHIGSSKTGSTAIQDFLDRNAARLKEEYALDYMLPPADKRENYHSANVFQILHACNMEDFFAEKSCSARKHATLSLLSFEIAQSQDATWFFYDVCDTYFSVTPICFVRDPVDWALSRHLQSGKMRRLECVDSNAFTNVTQIKNIRSYIKRFPDIIFLSYDSCKHTLLESFFASMNIAVDLKRYSLPGVRNRTFTDDEYELLRLCHDAGCTSLHKALYHTLYMRPMPSGQSSALSKACQRLTHAQRARILDANAELIATLRQYIPDFASTSNMQAETGGDDPTPEDEENPRAWPLSPEELIKLVAEAYPQDRIRSKLVSSLGTEHKHQVPKDFDPWTYCDRNREVLDSDMDVYRHYAEIGASQNLRYKPMDMEEEIRDAWARIPGKVNFPEDFDPVQLLLLNPALLHWLDYRMYPQIFIVHYWCHAWPAHYKKTTPEEALAAVRHAVELLQGRKVLFWGCGTAYELYKNFFSGSRPVAIVCDARFMPEDTHKDGIPLRTFEHLHDSDKELPVCVFVREAHIRAVMRSIRTHYLGAAHRPEIYACIQADAGSENSIARQREA